MADAGATGPVIDITPDAAQAVQNLIADGLDPNYQGMPATPAQETPWWLYILLAVGIYLLWED